MRLSVPKISFEEPPKDRLEKIASYLAEIFWNTLTPLILIQFAIWYQNYWMFLIALIPIFVRIKSD